MFEFFGLLVHHYWNCNLLVRLPGSFMVALLSSWLCYRLQKSFTG